MDAAVNNLSSIFSSIFSSKRPGQPLHLLWRVWNRWPQVFEKEQEGCYWSTACRPTRVVHLIRFGKLLTHQHKDRRSQGLVLRLEIKLNWGWVVPFWEVPDLWFLRYDNHVSCWATSFPSASKRWLSPAKEGKVLRNQNKLCSSWDRRFLGFDGLLITAQHRKFRIKLRPWEVPQEPSSSGLRFLILGTLGL
jgi:hypothetical protein